MSNLGQILELLKAGLIPDGNLFYFINVCCLSVKVDNRCSHCSV